MAGLKTEICKAFASQCQLKNNLLFLQKKKVSKKTFSYALFAPHGQYIDLELVWIQLF